MTVIKLPIKRLRDLENQLAQLEQQVLELKERYEAQDFLIHNLAVKLPDKARQEIYDMVKGYADFYANHPSLVGTKGSHSQASLSVFHDFQKYLFWSLYAPE
nr:MAG TPA: Protein of unknown function (DUF3138) [Caudoviricetes sp.]